MVDLDIGKRKRWRSSAAPSLCPLLLEDILGRMGFFSFGGKIGRLEQGAVGLFLTTIWDFSFGKNHSVESPLLKYSAPLTPHEDHYWWGPWDGRWIITSLDAERSPPTAYLVWYHDKAILTNHKWGPTLCPQLESRSTAWSSTVGLTWW